MTVWFVTRHAGAAEWAARQGIGAQVVAHLDPAHVAAGDTVLGTLPVHLAAQVCAQGARYLHLTVDVPADARGREMTADDLDRYGARLKAFDVRAVP